MAVASRTVRVFISSTFQDMHAERDHLVTVVFPELRERCEQLGLEFFDVDLRWGVPEKDANGETANSWEYCRQWIDRVEPFFVCMLGQRYGTEPEPKDLKAKEDRQRQQTQRRSITEMEVRHAVLNTRLKRRSYFYLRATKAPDTDATYVQQGPPSEKLEQLKTEVRSCGRPVREYPCTWTGDGFTDLEEFGRHVRDDLWSGVLRDNRYVSEDIWRQVLGADPDTDPLYTDESQPVPRNLAAKLVALAKPKEPLDAECEQMEAFAQARLRWFQGRTKELALLTDFLHLTDERLPRLAVVAAVPGQGKSSLLAKFATVVPSASTILITHFVGATERSTSAYAMVERLLGELDRHSIPGPAEPQEPGREPPRDFNTLCLQLVRRLGDYAGERQIVILLDGLNQLSDGHDLHWLPTRLGPSVRVVISCALEAVVQADSPGAEVLRAIASRDPSPVCVQLEPLAEADVRAIITSYLQEYCKELEVSQVNAICAMPQALNPLYLLVMLDALRTLGAEEMNRVVPASADDKMRRVVSKLIASVSQDHPDTVSLFRWVLQRLEVFGSEAVRWWCLYLAHGRVGMASHELAGLLDQKLGAGAAAMALRIERGLRRYLQRRGPQLDFFHSQLREAIFRQYGTQTEGTAVHRGLAHYFCTQADPAGDGRWRVSSPRGLSEAPFHQTRAGLWEELQKTLCSVRFIEAKCAAGMGYDLALDYIAAVTAIPRPEDEALEEQYSRRQLQKYFVELLEYARHPESAAPPQPVQSIPPGYRGSAAPAGLEFRSLRAFHRFVHGQVQALAEFAVLPGFVGQQAFNFEADGDVSRAAVAAFPRQGQTPCSWLRLHRRPPACEFPACVKSLLAHPTGIRAAALSSDGRWAVTAGKDHTLRRWDLWAGRCTQTLDMNYHDLTSIAMTHEARTAVVGDSFGRLCVLDAAAGVLRTMQDVQDDRRIRSVALSADGRWAVSASVTGQVLVWEVPTGRCVRSFRAHDGPTHAVALAVDGSLVVTGAGFNMPQDDGSIKVWATDSGECLGTLEGHPHGVSALALSHDGSLIVSAGLNMIRVWSAIQGVLLHEFPAGDKGINCLAITPDKLYLVAGGQDHEVGVWQLNTIERVRTFLGHTADIHTVALTPDARTAVSASDDGTLRVWDVTRGPALTTRPPHRAPVFAVVIREDGSAVSAAQDQSVRFWDPLRGECRLRRDYPREMPYLAALAANGRVAIVRRDNDLRVWDLDDDRITTGPRRPPESAGYVALSADGRVALTTSRDRTVHLWDTHTGRALGFRPTEGADIDRGTLSADGAHAFLAESYSGGLWSWTIRANQWVRLVEDCEQVIRDLICSGDNQYLITCAAEDIRVWSARDGQCLRKWTVDSHVPSALCLARDDRCLLSGGRDGTLRVWSFPEGKLQHVVATGEGAVRSIAVAGALVVLGTANGSVLFYDWTTRVPSG